MSEMREKLLTVAIKEFGFEDKKTVYFAKLCEEVEPSEDNDCVLLEILEMLEDHF